MPWSSQGGGGGWQGGNGGPWGRPPGGGGGQPPDLEDLLRRGQDRMRRIMPRGFGGGRGLVLILVLIVAVWLASGFYNVQSDEQGVELVFGRWVNTTGPGLNYNWPAPIGQVYRPKVTRVNRVEVGFRSGVGTASRQVPSESLMLTGDENIVDINFVVLWVIKDAGEYLFNIRAPEKTVKAVAESAMREIIGKTPIAVALAEGRRQVESQTMDLMQTVLNDYKAGIDIQQVQLQKVDPPEAVIASFRDVQAARADQERARNEAEAYRNDLIPRARGQAAKLTNQAEAYREEVVNRSQGDAQRFLDVLRAYRKAPDVTSRRIYLETMESVFAGTPKVIIDSKGVAPQGVVPYLPLDALERRPKESKK